ncbi:MAG: metallophosphoesterase [Anaerolineaceae bacterium]|nr:metallophosphoesterase [Anaerolineaceae bacterium]
MAKSGRKTLYVSLMISAPVVTGLVLAWLFSLEGTLGMYEWVAPFQYFLIVIGVLGGSAPLLAFFGRTHHRMRVTAVVLAIPGILIPLAIGAFYLRGSMQFATTTPPLLLVSDGVGANGVPNLALVFRTAQETRNTLSYGEGALNQQTTEASAVFEHVLALKDLKPSTQYQWKLNDSKTCAFTTPAVQATSDPLYHFGAGGDPHLSASPGAGDATILPAVLKYTTDPVNKFQTFFLLGDFTNMGSSFKDWQYAINLVAPFTCSVPLRPLMGNHDTFFNGAPQYQAYMYPQGMETPNGSRLYYRIDSGPVHIIMLNMLFGPESFTGKESAWFIKQMKSIPPGDWKIVMEHAPVYASGSDLGGKQYYDPVEMVQQVAPLFEKYKVDLVVSGHAHHLEFLQKNGVSYAIVGGLGAPPDSAPSYKSPASVWYQFGQHGFLDVTVHPASIEIHFRDPNGNELKSFIVNKNN